MKQASTISSTLEGAVKIAMATEKEPHDTQRRVNMRTNIRRAANSEDSPDLPINVEGRLERTRHH